MDQIKSKIKMKKLSFLFLIFGFCFLFSKPVFAATVYLTPSSQTVFEGDTFIAEIKLNTGGETVNALELNLTFSQDLLKVIEINKGGSVLNLFTKEPSASNGKISFSGGMPGGFKGEGTIGKIIFSAQKTGQVQFNFQSDSQILLNDGRGTSAQVTYLDGNYNITKKSENLPSIYSSTHPDQNKWFKDTTLHLKWNLIDGAEYSYLLSYDPSMEPDNVLDKPEGELQWVGEMEYPDLTDGIYYFTLKQKLLGGDWSQTVRFRAMIDSNPPDDFQVQIGQSDTAFGKKYFLSFAATDKTSGVDHYEISESKNKFFILPGEKAWKTGESPYILADQNLNSKILVKAIDKAGNETITNVAVPVKINTVDIGILIGILIIIFIAVLLFRRFQITK